MHYELCIIKDAAAIGLHFYIKQNIMHERVVSVNIDKLLLW